MANFLRMIRQGRWLRRPEWDWLDNDEIPSDALLDFQTNDNSLSVFKVESDGDIDRVVVALAANRTTVSNVDYILFVEENLVSSDIAFVQKDGDTPDYSVNQLHYDVINLTVLKVCALAQMVSPCNMQRVLSKTLKAQLKQAVTERRLDPAKVNESLLAKLT